MTLTPRDKLQQLETHMTTRLIEREEHVRCALVAMLSGQHYVLLGPPGTAKSMLVTMLCQALDLTKFLLLMDKFTEPNQLFGPYSIEGMKKDTYARITTNRAPEAQIVFLDEPFKANSAVLNALLTLINERQFDNGGVRQATPLISLFGASNELPQGDLTAFFDRFSLRSYVGYVSRGNFHRLIKAAADTTSNNILRIVRNNGGQIPLPPPPPVVMQPQELFSLMQEAAAVSVPNDVCSAFDQLYGELGGRGIQVSDRRWEQAVDTVRAHALLEGRNVADPDDILVLKHSFWNNEEQRIEIAKLVAKLANPINASAVELGDQAQSVYDEAMRVIKGDQNLATSTVVVEANGKLKDIRKKLKGLLETARSEGRKTERIITIGKRVKDLNEQIAHLILGADE